MVDDALTMEPVVSLEAKIRLVEEAKVSIASHNLLMQANIRIKQAKAREREAPIQTNWIIGSICSDVSNHPDKYGKDGMDLLKRFWSSDPRLLPRAIRFFTRFTVEDKDEILGMTHPTLGLVVSWEHINYVLTDYLSREEGMDYLRRATSEGLSAQDLSKLIQSEAGRTGTGHGRSHTKPTSKESLVAQVTKCVAPFLAKEETVWNGVGGAVELLFQDLGTETPDLVTKTKNVCELLDVLSKKALDMKEQFEDALTAWDQYAKQAVEPSPVEDPSTWNINPEVVVK